MLGSFSRAQQEHHHHLPDRLLALEFEPDVIFLLSDGASKEMNAAELKKISRLNRRGTHIHCVEFGTSPPSKLVPNFLMKLAAQNQGTHSFHNVKSLGQ